MKPDEMIVDKDFLFKILDAIKDHKKNIDALYKKVEDVEKQLNRPMQPLKRVGDEIIPLARVDSMVSKPKLTNSFEIFFDPKVTSDDVITRNGQRVRDEIEEVIARWNVKGLKIEIFR